MSASEDIGLTFYGRSWTIKNPCAYEWVLAVRQDPVRISRVFPGLVKSRQLDDMLAVMDELQWTPEGLADLERRWLNCARVALARASGRDWWRALNLINKILETWTALNGSLLLSGVDARRMPLSSWLDAAYVQLLRSTPDEGRQKLELELSTPPRGIPLKQSTASVRASLAAFAAD